MKRHLVFASIFALFAFSAFVVSASVESGAMFSTSLLVSIDREAARLTPLCDFLTPVITRVFSFAPTHSSQESQLLFELIQEPFQQRVDLIDNQTAVRLDYSIPPNLCTIPHPLSQIFSDIAEIFSITNLDLSQSYLRDLSGRVNPTASVQVGSLIFEDASIKEQAVVGEDSLVGPGASVKENAIAGILLVMGEDSQLKEGSRVGNSVVIGPDTDIKKGVTLGDGVYTGSNVQIKEGTRIGSGVIIGRNTEIKQGTVVGDRTIIGADVTVKEGAIVGNNVTIGSGVVVKKGATLSDGMVVPGITTVQMLACAPNPFLPAAFKPLPYNECSQLIENKADVHNLLESWISSAASCRDQASDIVSKLKSAVSDLETYVIEEIKDSDCFAGSGGSVLIAPSAKTAKSSSSTGDHDLLTMLHTCFNQLENVCTETATLWNNYDVACNGLAKWECGLKEDLLKHYAYILPQAQMKQKLITKTLYPNAVHTCNNFLKALDNAKSCGNGADDGLTPGFTIKPLVEFGDLFKLILMSPQFENTIQEG